MIMREIMLEGLMFFVVNTDGPQPSAVPIGSFRFGSLKPDLIGLLEEEMSGSIAIEKLSEDLASSWLRHLLCNVGREFELRSGDISDRFHQELMSNDGGQIRSPACKTVVPLAVSAERIRGSGPALALLMRTRAPRRSVVASTTLPRRRTPLDQYTPL